MRTRAGTLRRKTRAVDRPAGVVTPRIRLRRLNQIGPRAGVRGGEPGIRQHMRSEDNEREKPLHRRWLDRLGRWLRQQRSVEVTRSDEETEQSTTAASATMRERLDEPRD